MRANDYYVQHGRAVEDDPYLLVLREPATNKSIHGVRQAGFVPPLYQDYSNASLVEHIFIDEVDRIYGLIPYLDLCF